MSVFLNSLTLAQPVLAAGAGRPLDAVEQDLLSVYETSISDQAAEPKGQILSDIGQSLFERREWTAAASAYKAAAFAWIDLPEADPLWGLNRQYLQPVMKAAQALETAERYREAGQLYLCASKPLVRALSRSASPAESLQSDYDHIVARLRQVYAKTAAAQSDDSIVEPAFTISLSALVFIAADTNYRIRGLQVGYCEIPFDSLVASHSLGIDTRRSQWPLPTLGAKLLYKDDREIGELTHRLRDPRNRRRSDVMDIYAARLPDAEIQFSELANTLIFVLDVHRMTAQPGLTVTMPADQLKQLLTMDITSRAGLDYISSQIKPWLQIDDSVKLTLQSDDANMQLPFMTILFHRSNGFVEHKVTLRSRFL